MSSLIKQQTQTIIARLNLSGAYADGQQMGDAIKLDTKLGGNGSVRLLDLCVVDKSGQKAPIDFLFFGADPDPTSGDKQNVNIPLANLDEYWGAVMMLDCDYVDMGAGAGASLSGIVRCITPVPEKYHRQSDEKYVWVIPVCKSNATFTDEMILKFVFALDFSG